MFGLIALFPPIRFASILVTFICSLQIALAEPEATPQGNVYQFSGAVYVVNGDGQTYNSAAPAICPNNAPQSCGAINVWNWCCAAGCSCYQLANGVIGCCPDGQSCSGSVDTAAVSTVTVYASYPVTTTVTSPNTVVVAGAPPATTVVTSNVDTVVVAGATTSVSESVIAAGGGYCSTLYADGPNLPTTRAGDCGTILVVNDAIALWGDAWVVLEVWAWIWVAVISILWLR